MARIGEIISGKYEILREIGRGGMSIVYLAEDKKLGTYWAIKQLRRDLDDTGNQIAKKALLDEANMMKKLNHPALPRIIDIVINCEDVYVVMDYIEGESLDKLLNRYGAQSQEKVIDWANQLCDVLNYLHTQPSPIIYRDMKPSNIILRSNGSLVLIDLGIAREYKLQSNEDTQCIGTREYAAPEQFGGKGQTDQRTDIYALGVTLHYLITGKNPTEWPYELLPIRKYNAKLSVKLEAIIKKCIEINPSDRYFSCLQIKQDLLDISNSSLNGNAKKMMFLIPTILGTISFAIVLVVLSLKLTNAIGEVGNIYSVSDVSGKTSSNNISTLVDSTNSLQDQNLLESDASDVVDQSSNVGVDILDNNNNSSLYEPSDSISSTITASQPTAELCVDFNNDNILLDNKTVTQLYADTTHKVGETFTLTVKVINQVPPCDSYVGKIKYDSSVLQVVSPNNYYDEGQYANGETWFKSLKIDNSQGVLDIFHFNVINDFKEVAENGKYNYVACVEIEFKVIADGSTTIDVGQGFNSYFHADE